MSLGTWSQKTFQNSNLFEQITRVIFICCSELVMCRNSMIILSSIWGKIILLLRWLFRFMPLKVVLSDVVFKVLGGGRGGESVFKVSVVLHNFNT